MEKISELQHRNISCADYTPIDTISTFHLHSFHAIYRQNQAITTD